MQTDPDSLLNQLVVAALTVFVGIVLVLGALVIRQAYLQQQIANFSRDLQINLENLEETTGEIQGELSEIRLAPEDDTTLAQLEDITDLLDDVDAQLGSLQEDVGEVTQVLEGSIEPVQAATPDMGQDAPIFSSTDHIFTLFAGLVALAGVAVALFLGMALRVHREIQ